VRREDNYGRTKIAVQVDGEVRRSQMFGFVDLAALPDQVAHIGALISGCEGRAVRLRTLLEAAGVGEHVTHVTFSASTDNFSARCLFRKSGTSAWRGKRPARVGGHPATLARTPWIPAYAGMTQPTRNPTDWQCIYEMDI